MVRVLITLLLSLTISASAWAGNWNSSETSNLTSFTSIKLDCEMTNYRNTGYSVEWGQSWIPQKHTATISQGVIKSLTIGATGRVTRDTDKKIEFIFDETMDERNDQGRVKGIYFKTNGKLMTKIHFGSGYIDSGPIWGKCVEMDFLPSTQSKQNIEVSVPETPSSSKLDKAKSTCTELGFTLGTEKHGECVLKMMDS